MKHTLSKFAAHAFAVALALSPAPCNCAQAEGMRENVVVRGLPAEKAPAAAKPAEFTIASYNVQARPGLDRPEEKLPLISPLLNRFDVVLIQECFTRHDLLWAGNDFPNRAYFGRLAGEDRLVGSGLSIMNRLPMGEVEMVHFRDVGEFQNRLASKGVLMARLIVAGVSVDVYTTHMEAGASKEAHTAQMGQARQMIEIINRHSPPEHAVILMGDFNIGPRREGKPWRADSPGHYFSEEDMLARTAAFEVMRSGLSLRDAADEIHGPKDEGIERLLFREGTRCRIEPLSCEVDAKNFRRADGNRLSDGSPLVVRLRVTPK
jgi:endonuclease/exonuclease/phosphatase family metal-dependent hydrolase